MIPTRCWRCSPTLTGATDQRLRDLARRLAARLFLDLARRGPSAPREASARSSNSRISPMEAISTSTPASARSLEAAAAGAAVNADRLRIRSWSTPDTALCLVVDRSGSMGGRPLATAAIAAAAVALRSRCELQRARSAPQGHRCSRDRCCRQRLAAHRSAAIDQQAQGGAGGAHDRIRNRSALIARRRRRLRWSPKLASRSRSPPSG